MGDIIYGRPYAKYSEKNPAKICDKYPALPLNSISNFPRKNVIIFIDFHLYYF